jgi:centriolar protein POC1
LQASVHSVAFSEANGLIASGSKDRTVRLWAPNISKGRSSVIKAHTGGVRCVSFSPDSTTLLTASDDKTIKMWSIAGQKFKLTLSGHSNWHLSSKVSIVAFA